LLIPMINLHPDEIDHSVQYVVMSRSALFICITVLWPTYLTLGTEAPMFPDCCVLSSLRNVLQNELALQYFRDFLKNDKTSSNFLRFCEDVVSFQEKVDDHELKELRQASCEARELFNTYFEARGKDTDTKSDSQEQPEIRRIIPRAAVDEILAEIKRCESGNLLCGRDVFKEAEIKVFQHLEFKYQYFLRSNECKALLHLVNSEAMLFKLLIECKVI